MFSTKFDLTLSHRDKLYITYAYCGGIFALGVIIGGVGPMIPALSRQCDASLTEIKYVFPIRASGYVLGAILGGMIFDKYSGAPLLAASSVFICLFQLLAAFSEFIWMLSTTFFLVGLLAGVLDTGTNTLLVWVWQDEVAPYMSTMHFFFGCGAFLSPLVSALVLEHFKGSIKPAMLIQSALCLPVAFLFFITKSPSPPPTPTSETVHDKTESSFEMEMDMKVNMQGCEKEGGGGSEGGIAYQEDPLPTTDSDPLMQGGSTKELNQSDIESYRKLTSNSDHSNVLTTNESSHSLDVIVALFVAVFLALAVGSEVGYGGWISTYTMSVLSSSETTGAYVTSVFWGTFTVGRLISIPISSRISPQLYLFIDLVVGLIGCSIMLLVRDSLLLICIGSALIGLSIASMFPSCVSLPPSLGIQVSGKLTSYFVIGSSVGELLLPLIEGAAMEKFGAEALVVCCFIFMLLMCSLLALLVVIFKFCVHKDGRKV